MATLTIYEKPTCSTCRKLRALLRKLGGRPRDVLRTREPLVAELGLDDPAVPDEELISHMLANPALLQRPAVALGDRALLARPIERALELL